MGLMPLAEAIHLVNHQRQKGTIGITRMRADMGAEKDIGQVNNLAVRRDRFGVKYIKAGDDITALKPNTAE